MNNRSEDCNDKSKLSEIEGCKGKLVKSSKKNNNKKCVKAPQSDTFKPLDFTPRTFTPKLVIKETAADNLTDEARKMKDFVSASFTARNKKTKINSILRNVNLCGEPYIKTLTITELNKFINLEMNMDQMNVMRTLIELHNSLQKALGVFNLKFDRDRRERNLTQARFRLTKYLQFIKDHCLFENGSLLDAENRKKVYVYGVFHFVIRCILNLIVRSYITRKLKYRTNFY